MNDHPIRPAPLTTLILMLLGSLVLVWSIEATPLPGNATSTGEWFREGDPAEGMLAVLRLVVLVVLAYLLAATMLLALSALLRSTTLHRWSARVTSPAVQRFLRASVGLGIGTVTSLHSLAAGAAPPPQDESPDPVPTASTEPPGDETTTLTRVDGPEPADAAIDEPARIAAPAESAGSDPTDWWTVTPGDHLWRIAEETLVDQGTTAPSAAEVATYWRTLCEMNHDRLVDPGNPDLIMPGQQIALPSVSAAS